MSGYKIRPGFLRDDVSSKVVHLIRKPDENSGFNTAEDVFTEILQTKTLLGGDGCGYIKGGFKCVCFSETPISKLGQVLALPGTHGVRYKPFGFMVSKEWLFNQGGRPVIYQPNAEYDLLHYNLKYRHVRYEPPSIDFTWEREWRIQTDQLPLDPAEFTAIVPYRHIVERIKQEHADKIAGNVQQMESTVKIMAPYEVTPLEWQIIALEDLGVSIPEMQ